LKYHPPPPFRAFYTSFQRKLLKHFGKPYR
jgi:hypothetical protein